MGTHTYAILEVSAATEAEIREKLEAAGYRHAFQRSGGRKIIDMYGIALQAEQAADAPPVAVDAYEAGAATAYLLAETPEDWCWTFGYHPAHGGIRGRGPGMRRITLTLLLPQEPGSGGNPGLAMRFSGEMIVNENGASYLALAKMAVERAQDWVAGRNQVIPDHLWPEEKAAQSAATELLADARRLGGSAAVSASNLHAASMLVKLGLATVDDDEDGVWVRLVPR